MTEMFMNSLREIAGHLDKVAEEVDLDTVDKVVEEILRARRVFSYGAGRSGLVARCFAQRLMHLDVASYVIGETINPSCGRGDLVIIVSGSGETTTSVALASKAKELGARLVAVTSHPESSLGRYADLVLRVRGKTKRLEEESYAPYTTLFDISALAVLDSIAAEVMKRKGLNEQHIHKTHATLE